MVLIAHARGGDPTYTPGDQTGGEVRAQAWYLHRSGWNFVARFRDRQKARKAAEFARTAAANDRVGYGQADRNSLRSLARAAGWNAALISRDCNCDCTSFVSVCAEAGGVKMEQAYTHGNAPYSENIRVKLRQTGEFEILTDKRYTGSDQYALTGDIYVNEPVATGHAIICLTDGDLAAPHKRESTEADVPTPEGLLYTIVPGDTLWGIAQAHKTTVDELCALNGIDARKFIYPGQRLKIPGR